MSEMTEIEGRLEGRGRRFAIVAARFNERVVERLVDGALRTFRQHGVADPDVTLVRVPGACEVPLAVAELAAAGRYDGIVALAVVIRGETAHFDYVCQQCSSGCAAVALESRLPVGFGVLTCETSSQAEERAGGKAGNKGEEAALATLEMADLQDRLRAELEASSE